MADALDDLLSSLPKAKQKASELLSGARMTANQAVDQLRQTPANVQQVSQGLGIPAPDSWDVSSSLRSAKDKLVGLWRGYVAPQIRSLTGQ